MPPIKVGFVGLSATGWGSIAHAPALLRPSLSSSYTLTAVSTTSEASASASAKKYSEVVGHPVKPFHGDTSKIASDPDVDLVAVAVKAMSHEDAVLPAIEAGKDVFVEWPAGVGLKGVSVIAEAARKKGVRAMVGLQGRQAPIVKKVKLPLRLPVMNN
jgi:predicted dehydrogenase